MESNKNVIKSPYPDISPILNKELHEFIFERSQLYGDMTAFTFDTTGESMTFRQFIHKSKGFGAALLNAGYKKGDIAAILLPNCLEFPIAAFGCWAAGMTIACMNPRYTEDETFRQFQVAKAKIVITDSESLPIVLKAKEVNPSMQAIILTGPAARSYESYEDMVKTSFEGVQFSSAQDRDPAETIAWLPFSSGTTGPPKLAILTHAQIITNLQQMTHYDVTAVSCYLDTQQQERIFAVMPFFHAYGLCYILIMGLLQGAHTVIVPRYRPDTFLKVIRSHKPTVLHLVTPLVSHIVNSDDYSRKELQSVHTVFAGGAPVGTALINKLIEKAGRFVFFMEAYGMTEVLGTHVLNSSSKNTRVGSCGRPIPSAMAKVIDVETGEALGPHMKGEILLKTVCPAKGYFENEVATGELIDSDGWTHTGDIGYYDEDKYFYIVDRIKELIKVKGFQVAPSELEGVLRKHDKIADCGVIGIPSENYGQVPRAYVIPKEGAHLTEQQVHDYVNPLVATFKQLKGGIEITQEIPKSPSGKILRRELTEAYMRSKA